MTFRAPRLRFGSVASGAWLTLRLTHKGSLGGGATTKRLRHRPVKDFLADLEDDDLASVIAAMKEVRRRGLRAARHLDGDIYEVRADGRGVIYRILFAPQGKHKQILLSLHAMKKKRQEAPAKAILLAQRRLRDWEARGAE